MNQRVASRVLVALFLSFAGAACGGGSDDLAGGAGGGPPVGPDGVCANETRGETFAAGMTFEGEKGITVTLADSNPAPPVADRNIWTIEITDATGAPVLGAAVEAIPIMAHGSGGGHGTIEVVVSELGGGTYRLEPVYLSMPGLWNTTIKVSTGSVTDEVDVEFLRRITRSSALPRAFETQILTAVRDSRLYFCFWPSRRSTRSVTFCSLARLGSKSNVGMASRIDGSRWPLRTRSSSTSSPTGCTRTSTSTRPVPKIAVGMAY